MSLLSPPEPTRRRQRTPLIAGLVVLAIAGLGLARWLVGRHEPARPLRPPTAAKASPRPAAPTPAPAASPLRKASPPPDLAAHPAPLRVEADVADASVFVDRRFVGKAPLDLRDLAPGPHRVNVSAEGYAMHVEEVEIGGGPRTINVRFTEVRLDESLAVIHKHGVGSCQGLLKATPAGVEFEAVGGKDSFRAAFGELGRFEVDYLKKALLVSLRGGRAYNFTVAGPSADPLLVFQQKVLGARQRLQP